MCKINMPKGASSILSMLHSNGFDSYIVGGCVRDSLLGLCPHDWDICTAATPEQVKEIFTGGRYRVIETGLKHGTITIVMNDGQYEVTTFRTDGVYSDYRRPDNVSFVKDIEDDLARRDFTINAMAFDGNKLLDPFGGRNDLRRKIVSCVGGANDRFQEDALRILRALRFASVYGFTIEENTADAIHRSKRLLSHIAAERISAEICKLLCGKDVLNILLKYSDIFSIIIPELGPCIGFEQNNRYHQYTVYEHIAHAVANYTGDDVTIKLALLLHDVGKPSCYTEDKNGGHFYEHGLFSRDMAEAALNRLRLDNKTKSEAVELVLYHDSVIEPVQKSVRKWLGKIGERQFFRLLDVRMADIKAHAEGTQGERIRKCAALREVAKNVLEEKQCFSMKDLAIDGYDVMRLGISQGPMVGAILNTILEAVISGALPNDRKTLLHEAAHLI